MSTHTQARSEGLSQWEGHVSYCTRINQTAFIVSSEEQEPNRPANGEIIKHYTFTNHMPTQRLNTEELTDRLVETHTHSHI